MANTTHLHPHLKVNMTRNQTTIWSGLITMIDKENYGYPKTCLKNFTKVAIFERYIVRYHITAKIYSNSTLEVKLLNFLKLQYKILFEG